MRYALKNKRKYQRIAFLQNWNFSTLCFDWVFYVLIFSINCILLFSSNCICNNITTVATPRRICVSLCVCVCMTRLRCLLHDKWFEQIFSGSVRCLFGDVCCDEWFMWFHLPNPFKTCAILNHFYEISKRRKKNLTSLDQIIILLFSMKKANPIVSLSFPWITCKLLKVKKEEREHSEREK